MFPSLPVVSRQGAYVIIQNAAIQETAGIATSVPSRV